MISKIIFKWNFVLTALKNSFLNIHVKLNLLLNYLIVIFAFIIPFHPIIARKLIVLIFIIWLLCVDYKKLFQIIYKNRFILISTLFILYTYISFSWSEDHKQSVQHIERLLIYFYIPLLIFTTSIQKRFISYIIYAFMASMLINTFISYGIFFDLFSTRRGSPTDPVPFQTSHMEYSQYIAFTVLLFGYKFFTNLGNKYKISYLIITLFILSNLFLSAGRTGQFALIMSSFVLFFIYTKINIKNIILGITASIIFLFAAYNISDTFHKRVALAKNEIITTFEKQEYNTSIGTRIAAWVFLKDILDTDEFNHFIGTGIGDIANFVSQRAALLPIKVDVIIQYGNLHSLYFMYYIGLGIIGSILIALIFIIFYRLPIQNEYINFIKRSIVLLVLFAGFAENTLYFKETLLLFCTFTSIVVVQYHFEQLEAKEKKAI